MSRPSTAFDTPQFALIPDREARHYATVDNRVEFAPAYDAAPRYVPVVVPTHLFTIMKDVFKVPREDNVELFLHGDGDYYIFGMIWGEHGIADLWLYSESTLPEVFK